MWILTEDGTLVNTQHVGEIVDEDETLRAYEPEYQNPANVVDPRRYYDLGIFESADKCSSELRRIALALAWGANVYEVGKGIVQAYANTTQNATHYPYALHAGSATHPQHIPVSPSPFGLPVEEDIDDGD